MPIGAGAMTGFPTMHSLRIERVATIRNHAQGLFGAPSFETTGALAELNQFRHRALGSLPHAPKRDGSANTEFVLLERFNQGGHSRTGRRSDLAECRDRGNARNPVTVFDRIDKKSNGAGGA